MTTLRKKIEALPLAHGRDCLMRDDVLSLIKEEMEGKVLVPVEPTDEMVEAASRHQGEINFYGEDVETGRVPPPDFKGAYKAMLEASQ